MVRFLSIIHIHMCGILGFFSKTDSIPDKDLFSRAIDGLAHRGPDEKGMWIQGPVGLGFRRLSIIDLQGGHQPMESSGGERCIVFNGEIYNHLELRHQLESSGVSFKTRSDTEVILKLYEKEGAESVKRLRGMFAFALYDRAKNALLLARDRLGKKPLLFAETEAGFFFGSEPGPLLKIAALPREVDPAAIGSYLLLRYVPGSHTAWKGVKRLPPATVMWVTNGSSQIPRHYWNLNWTANPRPIGDEEAIGRFRELFEESVSLRMISDVPLGGFLSGGIDSSITVAAMARASPKVRTFCIGFEDDRFDESLYAREVSRRLGTEHHELRVAPDSLGILEELLPSLHEPFADQSIIPTFLLSRFARQHVTVALSGDGGDEFLAGYKRYAHLLQAERIADWGLAGAWKFLSRLSYGLLKKLNQTKNPAKYLAPWPRSALDRIIGLPSFDQYLELVRCWMPVEIRSQLVKPGSPVNPGFSQDWLHDQFQKYDGLRDVSLWQALDVESYLADDILRKVDAASMAASLECRCPLLDHRLVEFMVTLPLSQKIRKGRTKHLLRQLYPSIFPEGWFDREKKGFSMPVGKWMRKQWKPALDEAIHGAWSGNLENAFQRKYLQYIWQEHLGQRNDHGERLWTWYVLFRWNEMFRPVWPE
jgi:asparagine synthase (glutamine-hydrolysing)